MRVMACALLVRYRTYLTVHLRQPGCITYATAGLIVLTVKDRITGKRAITATILAKWVIIGNNGHKLYARQG